jgi:quercetin dioxygenase-like cupin family protein
MHTQQETEIKVNKTLVVKITDMVDYQSGSIVSKELIKKKTGGVTLFAFDKNERLTEHIVPFDAMVYIVDGEAEVVISGKPYTVKKDEMIIMPAGEPHSLKAVKRFKMVLTMIRQEEGQ